MPCKTKEEARASQKRWRSRNLLQDRERIKRNKRAVAEWFAEYKTTLKCVKCGESHPACLDFHHRDPATKRYTVAKMALNGCSIETIREEIEKCDVLCANCHRKEHYDAGSSNGRTSDSDSANGGSTPSPVANLFA